MKDSPGLKTLVDRRPWSGARHRRPLLALDGGLRMIVLDRELAQRFEANRPYAILSITDPGSADPKFVRSANLTSVCRLSLYDDRPPGDDYASVAAAFLRSEVFGKVELLVVHCEMGVSRSAGMALAIAEYSCRTAPARFGKAREALQAHFSPNRKVAEAVLKRLWETDPG